jgi:hypothetical protein
MPWLCFAPTTNASNCRQGFEAGLVGVKALFWVLRIFLRVIAQSLQANCPGADKASLHTGAVAFIHRFGSSLNEHVHFHSCAVEGVFEEVAGGGGDVDADAQARDQARGPGVIFHPATGVNVDAVGQAQASLRRRILRALLGAVCSRVSRPKRCWATSTAVSR